MASAKDRNIFEQNLDTNEKLNDISNDVTINVKLSRDPLDAPYGDENDIKNN